MVLQYKLWLLNSLNLRLAAILDKPIKTKPNIAAVLCHGLFSSKDGTKHRALAELLTKEFAIPVLRFDFSARGESDGKYSHITINTQIADLTAATKYLRTQHGIKRFLLIGSSFGALTALVATTKGVVSQNELLGLVLIALPHRTDFTADLVSHNDLLIWQKEGKGLYDGKLLPYKFHAELTQLPDIQTMLRKVEAPILVVHGEQDELFPSHKIEKLCAATNTKLVKINGEDHRLTKENGITALTNAVKNFVSHLLV